MPQIEHSHVMSLLKESSDKDVSKLTHDTELVKIDIITLIEG